MKLFSEAEPSWFGFFMPMLLALGLVNCQPTTSLPSPTRVSSSKLSKKTSNPDPSLSSYLGLSKPEAFSKAQRMNLQSRVTREDGKSYAITKNLRPNRINFELDAGRVTSAKKF